MASAGTKMRIHFVEGIHSGATLHAVPQDHRLAASKSQGDPLEPQDSKRWVWPKVPGFLVLRLPALAIASALGEATTVLLDAV